MSESIGPVTVTGPVAGLEFRSLAGHESLSQPFHYEVELLSLKGKLKADEMLGFPLSLHLAVRGGGVRHLNGYITQFSMRGNVGENVLYVVTLQPWLSLLAHRANCRILKGTAIDIVKAVFAGHQAIVDYAEGALEDGYPEHEFVVQYRESDLNFVMRILEEAGIYFYFTHTATQHTLVLADSGGIEVPEYGSLEYFPPDANRRELFEHIDHWQPHYALTPGVMATTDFDFTAPRAPLAVMVPLPAAHPMGDFEVFDYPGGYVDPGVGSKLARRRLEALQVARSRFEGESNARGMTAGQLFTLEGHPSSELNIEYLVSSVSLNVQSHARESGGGGGSHGDVVNVALVAHEKSRPFRPARVTPKPHINGVQTAIVVGEKGREIQTDLEGYGQVRVKFHWDRDAAKEDGSNCCWIRVSQSWAGANFGSIHNPRIGQEVLVEFLEGDPDRPIIVGRVYNNDNMPPFTLPGKETQSGIQTRSTPGGGLTNFNEIRFEDAKGSEELFIQAEKTQTTSVKGDQSISVNGNRSVSVNGTQTTTVKKKETRIYENERQTTVTLADTLTAKELHTGKYNKGRTETVSSADYKLTVAGAGMATKVEGLYKIETKGSFQVADNANCGLTLKGGVATLEAANGLVLKCGDTTITLKKDSITLSSATIKITGKTQVTVTGASSTLDMVGGITSLTGKPVKINS